MRRQSILRGWVMLLLIPLSPLSAAAQGADASPGMVITERAALQNFDFVWETIRDTHFDSTLGGVDWSAVRDELRPAAARCRDLPGLRAVLRQTLARLGQSHFGIIASGNPAAGDGLEAALERAFTAIPDHAGRPGVGAELRYLDGRVVVVDVLEAGSSARAGVRPGWTIEAIAGELMTGLSHRLHEAYAEYQPGGDVHHAYYMATLAGALLAGEASTSVSVQFRNHLDESVHLDLGRTEVPWPVAAVGGMPPLPVRVEARYLEGTPRIGYIRIHTVWLPGTVAAFEQALRDVNEAGALIVDIRGNMGGVGLAAQGVAGYLTPKPISLGTYISRRGRFPTPVQPRLADRIGAAFKPGELPLAVLIDARSESSSELFAAGLQDAQRARLFGEPSAGSALPAVITALPSGDRMLHATFGFVRANGEPIEGRPVQPDQLARLTRRALIEGADPALEAAATWIRNHSVLTEGASK